MMKQLFFTTCMAIAALFMAENASAQITIDEVKAGEKAEFRDSVKVSQADAEYYSEARYKAERAAIRKERNFLEMGASLQGTLTSHNDAWISTSGGDNAIAAIAALRLHHIFTKKEFTIETKAEGKFGYNRMNVEFEDGHDEGIWFKNQDEFYISTAPAYKYAENWAFGANVKFRSQIANGYKSRTEQTGADRKSRFMAPGYFDLSFGFTYTCPDKQWPFKIYLSPIGTSATFVRSEQIRANGHLYGITNPDKMARWEGGSAVQVDYDRTWGKNGWLRYRTTLYSFYGWITAIGTENRYAKFDEYKAAYEAWEANPDRLTEDMPNLPVHPTVRWENTIEIKATKYVSTQINFQLFYNRAQCYDVQLKTLLSVGFAYTFKNK